MKKGNLRLKSNPIPLDSYPKRVEMWLNAIRGSKISSTGKSYLLKDVEIAWEHIKHPEASYISAFPRSIKDKIPQGQFHNEWILKNYPKIMIPFLDYFILMGIIREIYAAQSYYTKILTEPINNENTKLVSDKNDSLLKIIEKYFQKLFSWKLDEVPLEYATEYIKKTIGPQIIHFLEMAEGEKYRWILKVNFSQGNWPRLFLNIQKKIDEIAAKEQKVARMLLKEKQSPSKVFIDVGSGWKWVLIEDSYNKRRDDVEADLMGHCATPEWEDSHLISLRGPDGLPYVTATIKFIHKDFFILGQVKGSGNKKPQKGFEPTLLALFMSPKLISQIPSDNQDWSIMDFSKENRLKIKSVKKEMSKEDLIKIMAKFLKANIKKGQLYSKWYDDKLKEKKPFMGRRDLGDIFGKKNEWLVKILKPDYFIGESHYFEFPSDVIDSFLEDQIQQENEDLLKLSKKYSSPEEMISENDELRSAAYRALESGYQAYQEKQAQRKALEHFSDFKEFAKTQGFNVFLVKPEKEWVHNLTPISFTADPEIFIEHYDFESNRNIEDYFWGLFDNWIEDHETKINDFDWDINHERAQTVFDEELSELLKEKA